MPKPTISESTVARIAGNLLSGQNIQAWDGTLTDADAEDVEWAVAKARAIVAEVQRTEPKGDTP